MDHGEQTHGQYPRANSLVVCSYMIYWWAEIARISWPNHKMKRIVSQGRTHGGDNVEQDAFLDILGMIEHHLMGHSSTSIVCQNVELFMAQVLPVVSQKPNFKIVIQYRQVGTAHSEVEAYMRLTIP